MTSARDVIESYFMRQVFGLHEACCDECDKDGCCTKACSSYDIDILGHTRDMLADLDKAGFTPPLPKAMFKPKVSAKAFARLDEMAEADIAMDGDHALSILLKHYRELTAVKEPTP